MPPIVTTSQFPHCTSPLIFFTAALLLVLLHCSCPTWALGPDARATPGGPTDHTVILIPPATHRTQCGFEQLQARTIGTRVIGISRAVKPVLAEARELDGEATPAAETSPTAPWQPLRIRVFTLDLNDSTRFCTKSGDTRPDFQGGTANCTSNDVLTDGKKRVLTELLIPSAIQMHEDRLNVQRVDGNLVVDASSINSDTVCSQFSIPAEHTTTGVSDADFVLYMSAGPTTGNTIAWATHCQTFADTGRPSVGVSNVSPRYISADPQTMRVITHELLHALGFSVDMFLAHNMLSMQRPRGKGRSPVLTSTNVVAQAQAQYGCPTQTFMELEDQGGSGTAFSHWKRRSAKDELMAGISGVGHYTALTIAAMEDLGFYRGNYDNAEPMSYGQNAGCSLTTSKCVVDGVTQFPEMFCDSLGKTVTCTSDHTALGYCEVGQYSARVPTYYQYFTNTTLGGSDSLMDYCPYTQDYLNTNCTVDGKALLGSTFGVNARCFNTPDGFVSNSRILRIQHAICAAVECGDTTYGVKVFGAATYTTCTPGATLSLPDLSANFSTGTLVCPSYDAVCVGLVSSSAYERYAEVALDNNVTLTSTSEAVRTGGVWMSAVVAMSAMLLLL